MADNATGKVARIYSDPDGCFIKLDYSGDKPLSEYFQLVKTHPNYNSLYSLAVVAAVNRYNLTIRVVGQINSSQYGEVIYMVVNW